MISIYAIKNPLNGLVFYVGASCNPKQRFRIHCYGGSWSKNSKRYKTMRELRLKKIMPELIIHAVVEQKIARQTEQFWIDYYISLGHPITQIKTSGYAETHSAGFVWKMKLQKRIANNISTLNHGELNQLYDKNR